MTYLSRALPDTLVLEDRHGRPLDNLRVSLTKRCNLACVFCHNEGQDLGAEKVDRDTLRAVFEQAAGLGIRSIKFSGGEPLTRKDVVEIVADAAPLFDDVSMTTNGLLLPELALRLKDAGLDRVNISLHSLDHSTYAEITQRDRLDDVLQGIAVAKEVGFHRIKLNSVILKGPSLDNLPNVFMFAWRQGLELQLIELETGREAEHGVFFKTMYHSLEDLERSLQRHALTADKRSMHARKVMTIPFSVLRATDHGLVFDQHEVDALEVEVGSSSLTIEIVRPWRNTEFCNNCTRLRLTSDGTLRLCLLNSENVVQLVDMTGWSHKKRQTSVREAMLEANQRRVPYWT